jgi:hypothetical protein
MLRSWLLMLATWLCFIVRCSSLLSFDTSGGIVLKNCCTLRDTVPAISFLSPLVLNFVEPESKRHFAEAGFFSHIRLRVGSEFNDFVDPD